MAITYGNVGGAEPSTITFRAATTVIARGSTSEAQEIIVIGDPETSNAQARVVAAAPAGDAFGMTVRIAGGPSSAVDLLMRPVLSSTAADNPVLISGNSTAVISAFAAGLQSSAVAAGNSSALLVRVVGGASSAADFPVRAELSSTAADNPVLISGNSTVVQGTSPWVIAGNSTVSILGAAVSSGVPAGNSSALVVRIAGGPSSAVDLVMRPVFSSTSTDNPVRAELSSTAADNPVVVSGNSTVVVSAFAAGLISSAAAAGNSSALLVRQVQDARLTMVSTSAFATSTQATVSASTVLSKYITSYSLTSTDQTATVIRFMGGSTAHWTVRLQAASGAVTGANLSAGSGYLFKVDAASSATLAISGSSRAGWTVSVGYYLAP